jgi:hypothetical protein
MWKEPPANVNHAALLQEVIGWSKVEHPIALYRLLYGLASCGDDSAISDIVWKNLHPRLESQTSEILDILRSGDFLRKKAVIDLLPRVADRILARRSDDDARAA